MRLEDSIRAMTNKLLGVNKELDTLRKENAILRKQIAGHTEVLNTYMDKYNEELLLTQAENSALRKELATLKRKKTKEPEGESE